MRMFISQAVKMIVDRAIKTVPNQMVELRPDASDEADKSYRKNGKKSC